MKKPDWPGPFRQHPLLSSRHLIQWVVISAVGVSLLVAGASGGRAAAASAAQREKGVEAKRFLLFGTVFDPKGFSLPAAEIQVRRADEKKIRWRAYSDRAGEFAVRVPSGTQYEVTVRAKGFETERRQVDATSGSREDMVFRMKPAAKGKKK
jgi:hypothetical protein